MYNDPHSVATLVIVHACTIEQLNQIKLKLTKILD